MTARIGRVYARNAEGSGANRAAPQHSFGERRTLFLDRRARLRERLRTAALAGAYAAAVAGVIATLATVL